MFDLFNKKMSQQAPKRKRKAATNALREIRNEQKKTSNIIPVAPMQRLVTEVAGNFKHNGELRFKGDAYKALHVAAEEHLIDTFRRANQCAIHNNRETVQPKDMQLAVTLSTV